MSGALGPKMAQSAQGHRRATKKKNEKKKKKFNVNFGGEGRESDQLLEEGFKLEGRLIPVVFVWLSWISSDSQCIPLFFDCFFECSMIFIYFVDFIDSERARRRAGLVHMYTFYKPKSKIGESRAEGPDVSEQIAVCLRERPGKSECETWGKIELSQTKHGCPFRIADGRKPYFFT